MALKIMVPGVLPCSIATMVPSQLYIQLVEIAMILREQLACLKDNGQEEELHWAKDQQTVLVYLRNVDRLLESRSPSTVLTTTTTPTSI